MLLHSYAASCDRWSFIDFERIPSRHTSLQYEPVFIGLSPFNSWMIDDARTQVKYEMISLCHIDVLACFLDPAFVFHAVSPMTSASVKAHWGFETYRRPSARWAPQTNRCASILDITSVKPYYVHVINLPIYRGSKRSCPLGFFHQ
jgi:hypothetical protein